MFVNYFHLYNNHHLPPPITYTQTGVRGLAVSIIMDYRIVMENERRRNGRACAAPEDEDQLVRDITRYFYA